MRRFPWLTVSVAVGTAAVSCVQLLVPGVLERLERTPAVREGEPWRVLTSLLVQDGGLTGTVTNLIGLAVLGVLAERVAPRSRWATAYLAAGLAGELTGVLWQPVGGGNSVAVCGLAAVVAVACFRRTAGLPSWAPTAVLLWTASMLGAGLPSVLLPAVLGAWLVGTVGRAHPALRYVVLLSVGAVAAVLVMVRDIHGAALAAGLVVAALRLPGHGGTRRMAG